MSPLEAILIGLAGLAAGTINTVVGSGTLITFPTLLAFGVPPVTANVSNTIGLVPGSVSGVVGYRRELVGQRPRVLRIGVASLLGGLLGAVLLLVLPEPTPSRRSCRPWSASGILLVVFQPRITALGRGPARRARGARRATRCWAPGGSGRACSSPVSTAATSAPPRACC